MTRQTLYVPPFGNFCVDSVVANSDGSLSATNATAGACPATPPPPPPGQIIVPPGYHRKTTAILGYSVQNTGNRSVDFTELKNLFGWASANGPHDQGPPRDFPFVSGAGPVIHGFAAGECGILHFRTPAAGRYLGSWAYQSNIGGPALDISISTIGGDFSATALWRKLSLLPDGQPWLHWVVAAGQSTPVYAYLANDTDYFFNIKYTDPHASHNGLFSIWYGSPI